MSKNKQVPPLKQYAVYCIEDDGCNYFNHYDSLEDAVKDNSDELIYEANYKVLGKFDLKVTRKIVKRKKL